MDIAAQGSCSLNATARQWSVDATLSACVRRGGAQAIDLQLEPVQQVFRLANNEVSPAKRMRLSDAEA